MADVRMKGFRSRSGFDEVFRAIDSIVRPVASEYVSLDSSLERVLYEDIISPVNVPYFDRSAVDGYAVKAEDTYGASLYNPLHLAAVGESCAGKKKLRNTSTIKKGEAVRIMTGGMMPEGADSCVMAEYAEERGPSVSIQKPVSAGENVSHIGEDIKKGSIVLPKGRALRPPDLGVLASVQKKEVTVCRKPRISLIVTGSELISIIGEAPEDGTIIDSNSHLIRGLAEDSGAVITSTKIIPDDCDQIKKELLSGDADMIIVTGGTSCGKKDYAPLIVERIGTLMIHGVAMKPGGPFGLGLVSGKPVFLLPGNPLAVCVIYDFFVRYALDLMQGAKRDKKTATGALTRKVPSSAGRTDIYRVFYHDGLVDPQRAGGASILSSMVRSNAYLVIPANIEGYEEGEKVEVRLFR